MLVRPRVAFNSTLEELADGVILSPSDILQDTNPHVRARPDMFEEVHPTFRGRTFDIEEATTRPGEKRNR